MQIPLNLVTIPGSNPTIPTYSLETPGLARQTDGDVQVDQVAIVHGRYEISGGSLTADNIILGTDYYSFPTAYVETLRYNMTQRGGTVSVGSIDLNPLYVYPMFRAPVTLLSQTSLPAFQPVIAGNALYEIHGGSLEADRINLHSGFLSQDAEFIQTGGSVAVAQHLRVFGQESRYVISGGSLQVRRLEIGATSPIDQPMGAFAILDADAQVAAGEFILGSGAEFVAAAGSKIRLPRPESVDFFEYPSITANSVAIRSTDPQALAGLNNLTLVFEGGSDSIATIEAAGADLGPSLAGFYQNFALDTLVLGGVEPASLSLVDLFQNHEGGSLPNALYVDRLVINEGSSLDLNGLNLYYRTASIAASGLITDASFGIQVVPEPAAAILALLAAPLFRRRRAS